MIPLPVTAPPPRKNPRRDAPSNHPYFRTPVSSFPQEHHDLVRLVLRIMPENKPVTIRDLARLAGLGHFTVREFVHGLRRPTLSTGLAIAKALGRDPYWLLAWSNTIHAVNKRRPITHGLRGFKCGAAPPDPRRPKMKTKEELWQAAMRESAES